jgi:hypothetical protein
MSTQASEETGVCLLTSEEFLFANSKSSLMVEWLVTNKLQNT